MRKLTLHTAILSTVLLASTALAQVLVDKTKLKEWSGGQPTQEQLQAMRERHGRAMASRAKFNNIETPTRLPGASRIAQPDPQISPNDVIDDGTRLKFNVVNWFMGDFIGIGAIRPVANTPTECVSTAVHLSNGIHANGKIYGGTYQSGGGQVINASYVVYNAETWEKEKEFDMPKQWYSVFDYGAYNPKDGKIYVIGYDGRKVPYLAELDTETGVYNHLVYCPVNLVAMTFDPEGKLYMLTRAGEIELIDLTTGIGTPVMRVEDEGVFCYHWHTIAFDHHTGELFWIRTDDNFKVDLRKIDLVAKTVEIVSDLPDYGACGMWIESPQAPDNAPNTIEKLYVEFGENGSHTGNINVTAPSTTFNGTELSGDVNIKVTVDGTAVGEVTVPAGTATSISGVDFNKSGEHKVVASVSNKDGNGPDGSIITYCGPDTPASATNAVFTVSADGKAELNWDAPTRGIHDGYFNSDLLTYDVIRYPDEVKVASGIKETSFSETLPKTLARYHYSVTVACDGIEGEPVLSNSLVYGDGLTVPVQWQLGDEDFFRLCTVYDLDNDGNTWYETWGSASCYTGWHDGLYSSDDWYITPPLQLAPGNYYVETSFMAVGGVPSLEVAFGNSQKVEDMNVIGTFKDMAYTGADEVFKTYVSVSESGKYYFGYHFNSTTNGDIETPYITIRSLKVDNGPADKAPEAVAGVSAKPFAAGELKASISFRTPTKTFDGSVLTSLDRVEICNTDNEMIGSVSPVEPGKKYTFTDESAKEGYNTYRLYACNEDGRGKMSEVEVYVGNDLADLVSYLTYSVKNNRDITLEWGEPPVVGIRGGYVNPADVRYDFCRSEYDWLEPFAVDGAKGLTELSYTWNECAPGSTFGSAQHMYFYGVIPVTPLGDGRLGYVGVVLGDPHQAPFRESFQSGFASTQVWSNEIVSGVPGWTITNASDITEITPSDKDGGMLVFSPLSMSQHAIIMPIVELRDMKDPVLVFDMYHPESAEAGTRLSVQASESDKNYVQLDLINVKAGVSAGGWTEHKLSLKEFNGTDRLAIALLALGNGKSSTFAVDNIRICDDLPYDIALSSLSAPSIMDLGETAVFKVKAQSKGYEAIDSYAIDIYADGVKVASKSASGLEPYAVIEIPVEITATAANAGKTVTYEARVNLDMDSNELNDRTSTTVTVNGSELPAPTDLCGKTSGKTMSLSWNTPAAPEKTVMTETFETCTSFAITGENGWKWIDGDRLSPFGVGGIEYPNMAEGRAYMVWAPKEIEGFNDKSWMPYEGDKCLIAFASSFMTLEGNFNFEQKSDEWLISPHIVGGTEVSFYAGNPNPNTTERFEVMVSYGGRNPEDFTSLGDPVVITEKGWNRYSYDLPQDAAYFAIHYISIGYEAFALLLDNIEFTAGYDEVELMGYNVYLNGKRVNDSLIDELTAEVEFEPESDNAFGVSAVYFEGESELAEILQTSGVESAQLSAVKVSARNGEISISGAKGKSIGIYDTLGNNVFSGISSGNDTVSAADGVYIVRVGTESYKIVVR